jgi:hypothetical protein
MPEVQLDAEESEAVSHGRAVAGRRGPAPDAPPNRLSRPETAPGGAPPAPVRLTHDGRLIAIGEPDGENLRPKVVLT